MEERKICLKEPICTLQNFKKDNPKLKSSNSNSIFANKLVIGKLGIGIGKQV